MLKSIFSVRNNSTHKIITILGIKINLKRDFVSMKTNMLLLQDKIKTYVMATTINAKLEKYRNCHQNKEIVIVGGGASLKYYKHLGDDKIYIGINRAYKIKDTKFDYLFCQDREPDILDEINFINYRSESCKKFIGHITLADTPYRYRLNHYVQIKNSELYILDNERMGKIPINISIEPFADLCGTVFSAMQFCLYTNPKRIYLYGFDCNVSHSFEKEEAKWDLSYQYNSWIKIKEFIEQNTHGIEIISVNPVSLKGLFKDVYTQSYLDAHPELLKDNIEIIKEDILNA